MKIKNIKRINFSGLSENGHCYRLQNEQNLTCLDSERSLLPFGKTLSYNDCCFNPTGSVVDMTRLNHLLSFDENTGIAYCQAGVSFADLFLLHPDFIPPVFPGTLKATIGGGIAHDVHGKNNPQMGSFGHHVEFIELQTANGLLKLNPDDPLFKATIGGLGLTGIICRAGIKLQKASRTVHVQTQKHSNWTELLDKMPQVAKQEDYTAAWLDLLNKPASILFMARHAEENIVWPEKKSFSIPYLPVRLIHRPSMRFFNILYQKSKHKKLQALIEFNNPLDKINHWNRLYGRNGLLQFQGVFDVENASAVLKDIQAIIQKNDAVPTLAVLKYFSQSGAGLLSFPKPGFTLAVDFIHQSSAIKAIKECNALMTESNGRVYLAKDLFLTPGQFQKQNPQYEKFKEILQKNRGPWQSSLSRRLEITS